MSKQCEAVSSTTNLRCTKKRSHVRHELAPMHQNGQVVWGPTNPVGFSAHFAEALRNEVAKEFGEERFGLDQDPEQQLIDWWMGAAADEVERTVPKAVEYSATDLADIGHVLARTAGRTVSDEEAAELGILFYAQGKMSRMMGAVAMGKRPSDDSIFDMGVYMRMLQRVRAVGSWPGLDLSE